MQINYSIWLMFSGRSEIKDKLSYLAIRGESRDKMKLGYFFIFIIGIFFIVITGGILLGRFNIGHIPEIVIYICAICTSSLMTITALLFMGVLGK